MDPWSRFERALETETGQAQELTAVLVEVDETDQGAPGERQELRAAASAVLAGSGHLPLSIAITECERAWAEGKVGWPSLYLAQAALRLGEPQVVLDSAARVPEGYFNRRDLHWREVQLGMLTAEALVQLGDSETARDVISGLNRELRDEDAVDEFLPTPLSLAQRLIEAGPPYALLRVLLDGLDLREWFPAEFAQHWEKVLES